MRTDVTNVSTSAATWEPAQLSELAKRWREHTKGVTLEEARERGWLVTPEQLAERKAYCALVTLIHHVHSGAITVARGKELAAAIVDGKDARLTPEEAEKIHDAPIPGLTVDTGEGHKPVKPREFAAIQRRVAAAHPGKVSFDGRKLTIHRKAVATVPGVPRARERRTPRSRRQRSSVTTRGSPASRSSDDDPPLTVEQRRWIAALVAAARADKDDRRRWEMHPNGGSRPLNGRRWLGSLIFVEVPLKETAFVRGDPAGRAVRVADSAVASTERTCEGCGRAFRQERRSHGPLCTDCRNARKQSAYRERKKATEKAAS